MPATVWNFFDGPQPRTIQANLPGKGRIKSGKGIVLARPRQRVQQCSCAPERSPSIEPLGNLERYGLRIGILLWIMVAMMHFSTVGFAKPPVTADNGQQAPLHIWTPPPPVTSNHVVGALEDSSTVRLN